MRIRSFDRRSHPDRARFSDWLGPDGWRHRRIDWPQPGDGESRGTLLLAGGRGDFIEKYMEPMAHWHSAGWAVTGFDWRGQGASRGDVEGGHLDGMDPLVADIAALAAEIGGEGPRVAIGHSMGGHLLLRAIAEEKLRPDAAVLVAPMLAINSAPLPGWAAWWTTSLFANFGWRRRPVWRPQVPPPQPGSSRQAFLTSCRERYEDELWWWEKEPGYNLGAPSWGWLEAAYRSCAALTDGKLRRVETPILLLGTDTDRLVGAAAIRRAASVLPNARLKMFADAGHEILREADPVRSEAMAGIDAFLDEAAPRR